MTVYKVSNAAQLNSALSLAKGGDTISLAAGEYGNITIANKAFTAPVTIVSADASHPATFRSVTVSNVSNLTLDHASIDLKPDASTMSWQSAFRVMNSSNITLSNSTLKGGAAVNGINPDATALDATGNVKGYPTGFGVTVLNSSDVTVTGNTLTEFTRGIVLSKSSELAITKNAISNIRMTDIDGADISNAVINNNTMTTNTPWAWGKPYGDHGDIIQLWTTPSQATQSHDITISGNTYVQGAGAPILGISIKPQTGAGPSKGFTDVTITDNSFTMTNAQGIRLEGVSNSIIKNNTLTSPEGGSGGPGIALIAESSVNNVVSGNVASSFLTRLGADATKNTFTGNVTPSEAAAAIEAASVSDSYGGTAAAIVSKLAMLSSKPLASLTVTDNEALAMTVTQLVEHAGIVALAKNKSGLEASVVVIDNASKIATSLAKIETAGSVSKIVISNNQAVTLDAATVANSQHALKILTNASGATPIVFVADTAAKLASNFSSLASATNIKTVTVTDNGVIKLSVADLLANKDIFAKFSGRYYVSVVDTADHISAAIDSINAVRATLGGRFSAMNITDSQPLALDLTEFGAARNMLTLVHNADGSQARVAITDTVAHITSNLLTIANSPFISSVHATDGAKFVVTAAQYTQYGAALAKIDGAHQVVETGIRNLPYDTLVFDYDKDGKLITQTQINSSTHSSTITSPVPSPVESPVPNPVVTPVPSPVIDPVSSEPVNNSYAGTAASIVSKLAMLGSKPLTSLTVTDNQALAMTATQLVENAAILALAKNQNGAHASVVVVDSASKIAASLANIEAAGSVSKIVISNNLAMTLDAGTAANSQHALKLMVNASGAPPIVFVADTAANLMSKFEAIADTVASATNIKSVTVTDSGVINLSVADLLAHKDIFTKFSGRYYVNVVDTADHISAAIDSLGVMRTTLGGYFSAMTITDSQPLALDLTEFGAARNLLTLIHNADGSQTHVSIADTAAHITSNLLTIANSPLISSVHATDGASFVVTAAQYTQYGAALAKIDGAHQVVETGIRNLPYDTLVFDYDKDGKLITQTQINSDGSSKITTFAGGIISDSNHFQFVDLKTTGVTLEFHAGMQSEIVSGFVVGADTLKFSPGQFSSQADFLAHVSASGGNTVIAEKNGSTITLLDVPYDNFISSIHHNHDYLLI